MANGDPVLVSGYEGDGWIRYFPFTHLVGPIIYVDPPFATVRAAQIPLVASVNSFCLCRLKTAAHRVEDVLRRRFYLTGRDVDCRAYTNRKTEGTGQQ